VVHVFSNGFSRQPPHFDELDENAKLVREEAVAVGSEERHR
jgi:hypothetical protein